MTDYADKVFLSIKIYCIVQPDGHHNIYAKFFRVKELISLRPIGCEIYNFAIVNISCNKKWQAMPLKQKCELNHF